MEHDHTWGTPQSLYPAKVIIRKIPMDASGHLGYKVTEITSSEIESQCWPQGILLLILIYYK